MPESVWDKLFAKKPLEKAAGKSKAPAPKAQDTSYIKHQVDEHMKQQKKTQEKVRKVLGAK